MSWAGSTFANYAYPGTWPRSNLSSPYYHYPYLSSAPVHPPQTSSVSPDSGNVVAVPAPYQKETDKTAKDGNDDRRRLCLVVSVSLMASLLFICVIVLIILVVLLQTDDKTTTPIPEDPTVGFPVTRTDLTFNPELSDSTSQAFKDMETLFCDMILIEWFQRRVTYDCSCEWFRAGSIEAYINLRANEQTLFLTNILSDLQKIVPIASEIDPRVRSISKSDVQIVQ